MTRPVVGPHGLLVTSGREGIVAFMSESEIQRWRDNIRNDTFANYYISMAVAIRHSEGAAAALPWIEKARAYPARQEVSGFLHREILAELGRRDEVATVADAAAELTAFCELAAIYMQTAVVSKETVEDVLDRAIGTADRLGARERAFVLGISRCIHFARQGDIGRAEASFNGLPVLERFSSDDLRSDAADGLAGLCMAASQAGRPRFGADVFHLYARFAMAGSVAADMLVHLMHVIPPAVTGTPAEASFVTDMSTAVASLTESDTAVALRHIGIKAFENGHVDLGEQVAIMAARIEPEGIPTFAQKLWLCGRETACLRLLEAAVTVHPDDLGLQATYASYLLARGWVADAGNAAHKALGLDPDHPGVHGLVGLALIAAGRPQDALETLRPFHGRFGQDFRFAGVMAVAHYALGRADAALDLIERVPVPTTNQAALYHCVRGCALDHLGRTADAERAFMSAAEQGNLDDLTLQLRCRALLWAPASAGLRRAGVPLPQTPPAAPGGGTDGQ